jgi:hypothetical protein
MPIIFVCVEQATVTMYNYQQYRHIEEPGWTLGCIIINNIDILKSLDGRSGGPGLSPKKEMIWNMIGSQATEQGDCSKFKSFNPLPHSCKKDPKHITTSRFCTVAEVES